MTTKKVHTEVDRARAPVVPARRDQRALAQAKRRHDLGRVGGRQRRARPDLRLPVAVAGRRPTAREIDQIANVVARDPAQSRFAAADRLGVERRRHPADEAAAVPRVLPVLRRRRAPVVPALPAQRRHLPRRAVQHRVLRAADAHGRAADATSASATSSGPAATATSTSTISSRSTTQLRARAVAAAAARASGASRRRSSTTSYDDFEIVGYQHHPALKAPVRSDLHEQSADPSCSAKKKPAGRKWRARGIPSIASEAHRAPDGPAARPRRTRFRRCCAPR